MHYKIQTLNNIADAGLEQFPIEHYLIGPDIAEPDAIIVRSASLHNYDIPTSVKVIGRAGAGVNNIPVEKLTVRGIPVLNTPGANANAVKELVLAGMLLACRNIPQALTFIDKLSGEPKKQLEHVEREKKHFSGFELAAKKLGVIGLGNVGVKVANMGIALGMQVVGFDPSISVEHAWGLSSSVECAHNIDDVLMESDFVTLHIPLIPETEHMINALRIKVMKPGAILLNFSRENIVDEAAVRDAIDDNHIYAYVCDFPSVHLQNHNRVICLPHLGASTREAEETCAIMIAAQIRNYLENGNVVNAVNLPTVDVPFTGPYRLTIINKNVPKMVAQITTHLGAAGINIVDLANKSQGDIAYTLIDVSTKIGDDVIKSIAAIEDVLQVRSIINDKFIKR